MHYKGDESGLTGTIKFGSDFDHFIGTLRTGQMWRDTWQVIMFGMQVVM